MKLTSLFRSKLYRELTSATSSNCPSVTTRLKFLQRAPWLPHEQLELYIFFVPLPMPPLTLHLPNLPQTLIVLPQSFHSNPKSHLFKNSHPIAIRFVEFPAFSSS